MEQMQDAKQVLNDFKKSQDRKTRKTRPMGSLGRARQPQIAPDVASYPQLHFDDAHLMGAPGSAQLAPIGQPPAEAASVRDGVHPQHHPHSAYLVGAHGSAQLARSTQPDTQPAFRQDGPHQQHDPHDAHLMGAHMTAQPATRTAVHQDGPQQQFKGPPIEDPPHKTSASRLCFWIAIAISFAMGIILAAMLPPETIEGHRSMSRDPRMQEPGDPIPALSERQLVVRLEEAVDIPGLHCIAGRLLPLSDLPLPELTKNPRLISDIFTMLKDLSDMEKKVNSTFHTLRDRASGINRQCVEMSEASRNQSPNALARVWAIRDTQSLVAQIKQLHGKIVRLQRDIRKQADGLTQRIAGKAESLCSRVGEATLKDFYRTQTYKSAPEEYKQLVLLHRQFCSTVQSGPRGQTDGFGQGSGLSAGREAGRLHDWVDQQLTPKADRTLKNFESGCDVFCSVIWYSYKALWGEAASSPSH